MREDDNTKDMLRLVEKLQALNDQLHFLHRISQNISEIKPLPELLHEIMESSKLFMKAEASSLLLYDPDDRKLHFYVVTGEKGELLKPFSLEMGEGIAGWVAEHREPALIEDCYLDPRFNQEYDKRSNFRTKSMICLPLVRKDRLMGVIQVINKTGGQIFDADDLALFQILASQCAIAIENHQLTQKLIESEKLERELELAREIQMNILPKSIPSYPDLDIHTRIIPARQVGGDYYNIVRLNGDQSLFVVADVCGKGIPAALIVSTFDACLNSYLKMNRDRFDMVELVQTLNRLLIDATKTTQFVTACFGLYDHSTGHWTTINAGHNPPVLGSTKNGANFQLTNGGIFLGSLDRPYEFNRMAMEKDDVLVYYTDGITEAWNGEEENYGEERLIQVISRHLHDSAKQILAAIEDDIKRHVGTAAQSDDITCLVIKRG
jgi:sigma-B regulation protein RsbU (phosphoserine phosphatase)